jgi:1,4-alpha-glucan branching enzyme
MSGAVGDMSAYAIERDLPDRTEYLLTPGTRTEELDVKKTSTKSGKVSVTFELPADAVTGQAVIFGDFNGWHNGTAMKRRKDGSYSATVKLDPGRYRYRYLIDGVHWENDWNADEYVPNDYGSDDSVVEVPSVDA